MTTSCRFALSILTLALAGAGAGIAQDQQRPSPAEPWPTSIKWFNLERGKERVTLNGDLAGKVVYLYCFQSWCPGCHSSGFPTLQELVQHYNANETGLASDADIAFVAIQTVFEGFRTNTLRNAKKVARKFDLSIPFGHDATSGPKGRGSKLMSDYRTRGTPYTIIIDKNRRVRFADFHITPKDAIHTLDQLAAEPGPALVGSDLAETLRGLTPVESSKRRRPAEFTLYRWWTDGCPHCEASLPSLSALAAEHGPDLRIVSVFHKKGLQTHTPDEIAAIAKAMGLEHGDIVVDVDWMALRPILKRASAADERFGDSTSIAILVDRHGRALWAHEGPRLHRSDDGEFPKAAAAFTELDGLLQSLLPRRSPNKRNATSSRPARSRRTR